jgi:hypothetical protein
MITAAFVTGAALLFSSFRGDFDHDGKPDLAQVIKLSPHKFELVVTRGADPKHPVVVETMDDIDDFYVVRAEPGRYQSACSKGYDLGPDDPGCKRPWTKLKGDNLGFGTQQSSDAIAIWTGKRFEVIWLSD